jgi:hypothetical protein
MTARDEDSIARLLAELQPVPSEWVDEAAVVPLALRALGEVEGHALAGDAALAAALAAVGADPTPRMLEALRRGLQR